MKNEIKKTKKETPDIKAKDIFLIWFSVLSTIFADKLVNGFSNWEVSGIFGTIVKWLAIAVISFGIIAVGATVSWRIVKGWFDREYLES